MEYRNKLHLDKFYPTIERLDSAEEAELSLFNAGVGFELFSKYIKKNKDTGISEAEDDIQRGVGVTHLIYNVKEDTSREIVAYFTASNNVIPYDDGIEDDRSDLSHYPSIPVAEIKMFAVSENYQDVFFNYEGIDMPISAWCFHFAIAFLENICDKIISFQAIFLHSLPTAEEFYKRNGLKELPVCTKPLYSNDQELKAMWLVLKPISIVEEQGENQSVIAT